MIQTNTCSETCYWGKSGYKPDKPPGCNRPHLMLTEDALSKDLLKKTNYSKNKTIESEAEMSTSSDELVLAGMVAASRDANTD